MSRRNFFSQKSGAGNVSEVCIIHNPNIPTSQFISFPYARDSKREVGPPHINSS